jgi:hypothetical protein
MPVVPGDMGIKIWSYEILVVSDGVDSIEMCEDCITNAGGDHTKSETYLMNGDDQGVRYLQPIFAGTEMDRAPSCDQCGRWSMIFSPTAECMNDWHEDIEEYLVNLDRQFNTDYLDDVADNAKWLHGYSEAEERTFELYRMRRKAETQNRTY